MKKISKYFFNYFLALFWTFSAFGQKGTIAPSAVRIGTDLGYVGISLFDPDKQIYEFSADVDVYKFFVTADYGIASWNFGKKNFSYDNSGNYFKVGVDYNLIARDPDMNVIYFGAKYAHSFFEETFNYSVTDPFYYDYSDVINKPDMQAHWYEVNFGMKVRVWKELYLGWAGRIKFAKKTSGSQSIFDTYYIPGYGKGAYDSRYGFNFQVFYRIVFRDKPPYKPKKEKKMIERDPEEQIQPPDNSQNGIGF